MRTMTCRLPIVLVGLMVFGLACVAQKTQEEAPTDSSAQASPIKPAPTAPVTDSSAQASPIRSGNGNGLSIAPHTEIAVKLDHDIDSGRLKNGDTVSGTLAKPVAASQNGVLPAGTPVTISVVETLAAGRIYASGEFSLQLERVGQVSVYTDTLTYRGQPGHKDLPDSAPAVGTDAKLAAGAQIVFHVLPAPEAANGPPKASNTVPGAVDGVANGGTTLRESSAQANTRSPQTKRPQP
jgi:hypothetical protein